MVYVTFAIGGLGAPCRAESYPIVDTGQERCYDVRREIEYPQAGEPFYGQDAQYRGNPPTYRDNGDGTISDLVTGLMWQKDPGPKKTFAEAVAGAAPCRVGGYADWRLPSIKELYSLILFSGEDVDPHGSVTSDLKPFINKDYFGFVYGDPAQGERIIDSQMATSTKYVSTTMRGNETMFGVNFADGRIKGYPAGSGGPGRRSKKYYVFYVRGNTAYGKNDFRDNGDGTITDRATGLTWLKSDSGHLKAGVNKDGKLNWEQALRWTEELEYAGHSDWRLPNAKELHSIVDYTRSPDTTRSAAIDPVFRVTPTRDALGKVNYPFYWSSTTHKRMGSGEAAVYIAFGRSQGWMSDFRGQYDLLDVHGAGSQRSDPKAGDPSQFPRGRGPQGDVIQIYNMVRPVRGGKANLRETGPPLQPRPAGPRPGGPGPRGRADLSEAESPRRGPGPRERGPIGPGRWGPRPPIGGDPPRFVTRLDRNGDGKVSRQEFDGPPGAFDRLDADRDGYLTEAEAPHRRNHPGPPPGLRPGPRRGMQPPRPRGPGGTFGQSGGSVRRPATTTGRPATGSERLGTASGGPGAIRGNVAATELDSEPATVALLRSASIETDAAKKALPSFVFILVDDMGWTGLSCAMQKKVPESKSDFYQTPRIDELARQGMRFSHAYSPSSMCTPSRASLLTGKSPALLRMTTPGPVHGQPTDRKLIPPRHVDSLPDSEITIAEILRRQGYATAHFGKWHLAGGGPGNHGFEQHDGDTGNGGPGLYGDPNPKDIFGITKRAIRFMDDQVAAGRPFYVQLSHYAVHGPSQALRRTTTAFAERPAGTRHHDVDYAAMTGDLDTSVGTVLDSIDRLGLADNTYVVFMSDNGAAGRPRSHENWPLAGGKATFWEGGIRVPLIVRGPGVEPNSFCHHSVVGYDLFPTFCELADLTIAPPVSIEGTSLVPLLLERTGGSAFQRDRAELVFHFPHYARGPNQTPQSAILAANFKLIRFLETNETRLFDLDKDIGEQNDLTEILPDKSATMAQRLDAYLADIDAQLPAPNPEYDPVSAGQGPGSRRGQRPFRARPVRRSRQ
jgi:arylsulfatase A-like enzyme